MGTECLYSTNQFSGNNKVHGKKLDEESIPNRVIRYEKQHFLGVGKYGSVFQATAYCMNYELKKLTYKNKAKVVKVIPDVTPKLKAMILAECRQGKKTPHLGMKDPVFSIVDGVETAFIVMNYIPGKELFYWLNSGTIDLLYTEKKLELTYLLLLALQQQVKKAKVVHRDIKPENLMLSFKPHMEVNLVDFGFAKGKKETDSLFPGSPLYAAPEIFEDKPHNIACDVFSMARVIALLWVIYNNSTYFTKYGNNPYVFALMAAESVKNNQSEELKKHPRVLELLMRMLEPDQSKRISITEAIQFFESNYPFLVEKNPQYRSFFQAVQKGKTNGETPLFRAVMTKNLGVIKALVVAGADIRQTINISTEYLKHELRRGNKRQKTKLDAFIHNHLNSNKNTISISPLEMAKHLWASDEHIQSAFRFFAQHDNKKQEEASSSSLTISN